MDRSALRGYLTKVAGDSGKTTMDIARAIGVSSETLKAWMVGKTFPTEDEMLRFCEAAGAESLYKTVPGLRQFIPGNSGQKPALAPAPQPKPAPAKPAAPAETREKPKEPAKEAPKAPQPKAPAPQPKPVNAPKPQPKSAAPEVKKPANEPKPGFMPEPVREEKKTEVKKEMPEKNTGTPVPAKPEPAAVSGGTPAAPTAKEALKKKPAPKKKLRMTEEVEAAFRGVIKKGDITREALADKVPELVNVALEAISALGDAVEKIGGGYIDEVSTEHIPERLKPLMEAAMKASDKGIEVAVTILNQFVEKK